MTHIKSYANALAYLLGLTKRGVRPGLERVQEAMARLGHPEEQVPGVVVGGTNGKGSVAAMIARAVSEQGSRVGLFTSPHLHRLTERIRLADREVGRRDLVGALNRVINAVEVPGGPELTFFETLTVMAADLFAREGVDLAVYEVGLGGRLDATKLVPADVVVITNVALDHQKFLGDTIESVAREKFALVWSGAVVVGGRFPPHLQDMIIERADDEDALLWLADRDYTWEKRGDRSIDVQTPERSIERLHVPLRGEHQVYNTAVAVAAIDALAEIGMTISEDSLREAMANLKWPARLELIRKGKVLLDVAHNPAGMESLIAALPDIARDRRPIVAVAGCMRDKDVRGIMTPLAQAADQLLLAAPRMERALPPEEFPEELGGQAMPSVEEAADEALRLAGEDGLVVIAGSTFVVSEARAHLLRLKNIDPAVPM